MPFNLGVAPSSIVLGNPIYLLKISSLVVGVSRMSSQ